MASCLRLRRLISSSSSPMRNWSSTSVADFSRNAASSASSRSTSGEPRAAEREAPAHADPHRAQHGEIRRRAVVGVARPAKFARGRILERSLDEVGKLEILEQDVEEFGFAEREGERVLAAAGVRSLPTRSAAAAALRFVDAVPSDELLVAGQNVMRARRCRAKDGIAVRRCRRSESRPPRPCPRRRSCARRPPCRLRA